VKLSELKQNDHVHCQDEVKHGTLLLTSQSKECPQTSASHSKRACECHTLTVTGSTTILKLLKYNNGRLPEDEGCQGVVWLS